MPNIPVLLTLPQGSPDSRYCVAPLLVSTGHGEESMKRPTKANNGCNWPHLRTNTLSLNVQSMEYLQIPPLSYPLH